MIKAWVTVFLFIVPCALSAQTQTTNFPVASTTGTWALGGCGTATERGTSTTGDFITFTWTDTTGALSGFTSLQLQSRWKFYCGSYSVTINGTVMGAGVAPTPANCSCNATPLQTTTQTYLTGFPFNSNGTNTVTYTHTGSGYSWVGIMDSAGWATSITVINLNQPPAAPTSAAQFRANPLTQIPVGGTTASGSVVMQANVVDPDGDDCFLEIELVLAGIAFTNTAAPVSQTSIAVPSGTNASVSVGGQFDGAYHWQIRSTDDRGASSAWVAFGGNPDPSGIDFIIDTTVATGTSSTPGYNAGGGDCSSGTHSAGWGLVLAGLAVGLIGVFSGRKSA